MSGAEHHAHRLGYQLGCIEVQECSQTALEAMHEAMRDIMDLNTAEPDHPGNMAGENLAMIAGRLEAYNEWLGS